MDEKTANQLALIHSIASDVREVQRNCDTALRLLSRARQEPVTIEIYGTSVRFTSPQNMGFNLSPLLEMNETELADLRLVIHSYQQRVGKVLDGCSIKVSPEIREMQAKIEAKLEDLKKQVADSEKRNERKL